MAEGKWIQGAIKYPGHCINGSMEGCENEIQI